MLEPDHSGVFRQHDSGLLHKQGRRYEVRLSLCSPLEAADVVQPEADCIAGQAYSGPPQCHCGQIVPTRLGDTNGVVPPAGSLRPDLQEMAQAGSRSICDQVQSQTSQVCGPVLDPLAWKVDALSVPWQNLDAYAFPPVALLGKVVFKLMDHEFHRVILVAPGWPNMP